jgi:hypothetical protein
MSDLVRVELEHLKIRETLYVYLDWDSEKEQVLIEDVTWPQEFCPQIVLSQRHI